MRSVTSSLCLRDGSDIGNRPYKENNNDPTETESGKTREGHQRLEQPTIPIPEYDFHQGKAPCCKKVNTNPSAASLKGSPAMTAPHDTKLHEHLSGEADFGSNIVFRRHPTLQ